MVRKSGTSCSSSWGPVGSWFRDQLVFESGNSPGVSYQLVSESGTRTLLTPGPTRLWLWDQLVPKSETNWYQILSASMTNGLLPLKPNWSLPGGLTGPDSETYWSLTLTETNWTLKLLPTGPWFKDHPKGVWPLTTGSTVPRLEDQLVHDFGTNWSLTWGPAGSLTLGPTG